ncbi:MAG TPA: tetratricopeptide repeat protein [Cyclobacteriaceae bacterium]|nr:tetratricopeptide repeat protein [Cyclobacteriaceae bacterium]
MKVSHCLVFTMCVSFFCHAQTKLDSLKSLFHKARTEQRVAAETYQAYFIAMAHYEKNEFDSALHYFNLMVKRGPNDATRASGLNGLGMVNAAMGYADRSIQFYSEAIRLYETLKDTSSAVTAGNNLAIIYSEKGLYDNALEMSFRSLAKLERQKPNRTFANAYNTIGMVYAKIGDYAKSYDYYRKALHVRLALRYELGVAQSYNNIGEMFNFSGEYDSALTNLAKAADIRQRINDERGLGRTQTLTGKTFLKLGRTREAKDQFVKALTISRKLADQFAETYAIHGLAEANISLKDFKAAEQYLSAAESLIKKTKSTDDLRQNLELKAGLYKAGGDRSRLISTLERLMVVKDSLLNNEKMESLLSLEIQYETEKKEQEIRILQQQQRIDRAELERSQIMIIALVVIAFMLVAIAVLVYQLYRFTRQRKERAELHTKELHHRVTNNLQMLISFFTIQASLVGDEKAAEVIRSTESRVNAMMLIHKKLYSKENTTELRLKDYTGDLINYLLYLYGYESKLTLDVLVVDMNVMAEKAIPIGLVLNELISNSLKHAYIGQSRPSLKVHVSKNNEQIVIEIGDNGSGSFSNTDPIKESSFGLKMVNSLIREIHGSIERLTRENGTQYLIKIPV